MNYKELTKAQNEQSNDTLSFLAYYAYVNFKNIK